MEMPDQTDVKVRRVGGILHKVIPLVDGAGKVIHYAVRPLMVEFKIRDVLQIVVGASLLAVPVAFTEEVWNLGSRLPVQNVAGLAALSLGFVGLFVYFNFYRDFLKKYPFEYVKRVLSIYLISLLVVSVILALVQQFPLDQPMLAVKRAMIVAFPASMSAAVSDMLK
jgi:uncharacterized membrane protein